MGGGGAHFFFFLGVDGLVFFADVGVRVFFGVEGEGVEPKAKASWTS